MNKFKSIVLGSVVAVSAMSAVGTASAIVGNTNNASCAVNPVNEVTLYSTDKNFTYNSDGTVTGQFKVTGNANCRKDVTFASWEAPSRSGYPLSEQKLLDYKTGSFGVGTHTLTVNLPKCYWQIDLLEGTSPTADDGSADYGFGKAHMLDVAHGGTNSCDEKPEVPVTPEVPETPVTPETPEKPVTPAAEVKTLPSTGPGSIIASTMGLSTSAGLAYNLIQSRRKLK